VDNATIGRVLLEHGYRTSWFGKDHNTPEFQASQAGPFDQWPTGMGFEYFYGFVGGDTSQWQPKGGIRHQFHHVIDIAPTILEATGIRAPNMVDGIAQKPIEGVSMVYTFEKANAGTPTTHKTQYFEMFGVQGLYDDGWMLSAVLIRPPWELLTTAILDPASAFKFELYNTRNDWTQYTDLAAANPAKVKEMQDLMFAEFAKYQVLPLDASVAARVVAPRPSLAAGRRVFTFSGETVTGIPPADAPNLLNTSYTITAEITVPPGGAEGMIHTNGGRFGGYGLYLLKGKPVFLWNLLDLKRVRWEGRTHCRPASIGWNSISNTTGSALRPWHSTISAGLGGRAPARSRWTAGRWRHRRWTARFLYCSRSTRPSTSAPIPVPRWTTATTGCRSNSPARSTN
jgi:hypothetical protein